MSKTTWAPLVKRGLSSDILKYIAIAAMVCDHASVAFHGQEMTPFRWFGRIAFPIFCFFIAVGAEKTKNPQRYMGRLLVFALVSEVPFDLACSGKVWDTSHQNVLFTLLLGLFAVRCAMLAEEKKGGAVCIAAVGIAAACALALLLRTDYNMGGVLCILCCHFACRAKHPSVYILLLFLAFFLPMVNFSLAFRFSFHLFMRHPVNKNELTAFAVVPLLLLYDGRRGSKRVKYLFYAFYPAHLLILGLIRLAMGR